MEMCLRKEQIIMIVILDADINGNEVPLAGDNFLSLLDICFAYSEYFSLIINRDNKYKIMDLSDILVEERLFLPSKVEKEKVDTQITYIQFYRIDAKAKSLILKISDDFWKFVWWWGNRNPEDLTFYRKDSSVFMRSIAHEGKAIINPLPSEDLSPIFTFLPEYYISPENDWQLVAGIHEKEDQC